MVYWFSNVLLQLEKKGEWGPVEKPAEYDVYKYPRTPHLPFSLGATSDDKHASPETMKFLQSGVPLVVTEKLDGGNISMYRDYYHGRSLDSGTHAWETVSKRVWSEKRFLIPAGWRVSCESLYARRSVAYDNLESFVYVFGVMDENKTVLDWDTVELVAAELGLPVAPVLYRGSDYDSAVKAWGEQLNDTVSEGFVLRNAGSFPYSQFEGNVAKMVRANHARTNADWRHRDDFKLNKLRG